MSQYPDWQSITTRLNLDEHIGNYNGHMQSNLTGPVDIPSTPTRFPVPRDQLYFRVFTGPQRCTDEKPDPKWCNPDDLDDPDLTKCPTIEQYRLWGLSWWPEGCVSSHGAMFRSMNVDGASQAGWELSMYDNDRCEGEPLGKIEAGENGDCVVLPDFVVGVAGRPRWNWN